VAVRLERRIAVRAPAQQVWTYLTDPANYPRFMHDISRWDVEGERSTGLGARYSIRMKVGTAHVGGLVEVVEFQDRRELAWTSITGVDHRGRFRLRARGQGETEVTFRLRFNLPGGLLSRVAERVAGRIVDANMRRSLEELQHEVETEPPAEE
jgi:uncharacterized membrane protein